MEEIVHSGVIISIDPQETGVEIVRGSACSSCHAKSLCGVADAQKKVVYVPTDAFAQRSVGDEVTLGMKRSMGMKAVWISYVIPLIVLMTVILSLYALKAGELATGLGAIAAVAIYYIMVYVLRDKLKKEFVFYIK